MICFDYVMGICCALQCITLHHFMLYHFYAYYNCPVMYCFVFITTHDIIFLIFNFMFVLFSYFLLCYIFIHLESEGSGGCKWDTVPCYRLGHAPLPPILKCVYQDEDGVHLLFPPLPSCVDDIILLHPSARQSSPPSAFGVGIGWDLFLSPI